MKIDKINKIIFPGNNIILNPIISNKNPQSGLPKLLVPLNPLAKYFNKLVDKPLF